jgi:DNA-directed RNA polymerase specialized sigma24 family protein
MSAASADPALPPSLQAALPEVVAVLSDPALTDANPDRRAAARGEAAASLMRVAARAVDDLLAAERVVGPPAEAARRWVSGAGRFFADEIDAIAGGQRDPQAVAAEGDRLLRAVWRRAAAGRAGELTRQHHQKLVECVRARLRYAARAHAGATASAVAQSVWASVLGGHIERIDLDDPEAAWPLILRVAVRHCERWNKQGYRHPSAALDAPPAGGSEPLSASLADADDRPAEDLILWRACSALLDAPTAPADLSGVFDGWERLSAIQRQVLLRKLVGFTADEIAESEGVTTAQVNYQWQAAKEQLRQAAA